MEHETSMFSVHVPHKCSPNTQYSMPKLFGEFWGPNTITTKKKKTLSYRQTIAPQHECIEVKNKNEAQNVFPTSCNVLCAKFDFRRSSLPKLVTGNCMIFKRNDSLECTFSKSKCVFIYNAKTINIMPIPSWQRHIGIDFFYFALWKNERIEYVESNFKSPLDRIEKGSNPLRCKSNDSKLPMMTKKNYQLLKSL